MKPSAIKKDIKSKARVAVAIAQPQVRDIFQSALNEFYGEFTPKLYKRTDQLMNSLDMSAIIPVGNGYEGDVYFNVGAINYIVGTNVVPLKDGSFGSAYWSGAKAFYHAARGSHGGYTGGTAIWYKPIGILNGSAHSILISACKAAGL